MNAHTVIPLIASVAYIPLFIILLLNRPWNDQQRLFILFLLPAFLWSFSDVFFRSDFFPQDKVLLVQIVLSCSIWTAVGAHYFLHSFYQADKTKFPFIYILPVSTVVLAALGYIPGSVEAIATGLKVNYGITFLLIIAIAFAILIRDAYLLVKKRRILSDISERNRLAYLILAIAVTLFFTLSIATRWGSEYPASHLGNMAAAGILTYSIMAYRLLDIRVVFRRMLIYVTLYATAIALFALLFILAHLVFNFKPDIATLAVALILGIPIIAFFAHRGRTAWKARLEQTLVGEKYNYRRKLSLLASEIQTSPSLEKIGHKFTSLLAQSIECQRASLLLPENVSGDFRTTFTYPPVESNPLCKLKLRGDSPIVAQLKKAEEILSRDLSISPQFQSMWQEEKEDIRSAAVEIFLPLINDGELVAIMAIGNKQDGKLYSVEDIHIVESINNSVAASIERAHFLEQLRERDEEIELISHLTSIITSNINIEEIFEGFIQELRKVISVDWAAIALLETDELRFWAISSARDSSWQVQESIPLKGTTTELVCKEKRSIYEPDIALHQRFRTAKDHLKQGMHSILNLPLVIKNRSIGSLILASYKRDAYTSQQIKLLEQLTLQIAHPVENSRIYAQVSQRARIDELTGLFNRRHFEERLKIELARHARYGGVFSLFMIDLDGFKTYNDLYGHPSGDELLRHVGKIIMNSVRNSDQSFRYGGDEFTVILPETPVDDAYSVAERVREQIALEMDARQIALTCSIGLSSYPSDGVMSGELVTSADTALYYAKRTGGNRSYLSSRILSESPANTGTYARGSGLSAVYALASAVDAKDPHTYDHSRKVNIYAVALAEAIGLPPDNVSRISTAALLHDIGKIGIPDKILNKDGPLNKEEWEAIRSHPRLGANIVGNIPGLVPTLSGILYHHERYDGSGYPEGLKGEEIPIEARIMSIADAYAAMTSARSYRDAYHEEKALRELKKNAGKQFDPGLTEAFITLVQSSIPSKWKQE